MGLCNPLLYYLKIFERVFYHVHERRSCFQAERSSFPDYIFNNLPHREKEIKTVSSIINSTLKNPSSVSNVFIYGSLDTGKTASVKFIFRKLEEETSAFTVYLNCFKVNTR